MKITVTGDRGFIGTHVVNKLLALGHEVIGVDYLDSQVHGEHPPALMSPRSGYVFAYSPVGDYPFEKDNADVIIHLAARVGVGQSMYDIPNYVAQNSLETASMLDSLQHAKPKRLIVASSMSVYGEGGNEPVREDRPVDIRSIYALTKYDQEQMCLIWGKAYKVPTVALRFFNVYGPGQSLNNPYTGVMAIFASRVLNDNSPVIYGDGKQTRDFIHVDDVANAVVHAALESSVESGIYNVGTGDSTSINDVANFMCGQLTFGTIYPKYTHERQGDVRHCIADIEKLAATGWVAYKNISEGMMEYFDWLRSQPKPIDRFEVAHKELVAHGLTH